jgi:SAM-dependent methyltransferase
MKNDLAYFTEEYLKNRPLFFSFIRPQEAFLFYQNLNLLKSPILDLGCGDGFFAELTFGKQTIDVGLDVPSSLASIAEQKRIYKKVVTYEGGAIPFLDNSFGSVVSNCVLEHIPDLEETIQEVYRVLRCGGYFITTVMADKWNDYLFGSKFLGERYVEFMKRKQVHHHLLSYSEWKQNFEEKGFKVEKSTGYVSKGTSLSMDIAHYASIPSLISHRLLKQWVLFPSWYKPFNLHNRISSLTNTSIDDTASAAYFFICRKLSCSA